MKLRVAHGRDIENTAVLIQNPECRRGWPSPWSKLDQVDNVSWLIQCERVVRRMLVAMDTINKALSQSGFKVAHLVKAFSSLTLNRFRKSCVLMRF